MTIFRGVRCLSLLLVLAIASIPNVLRADATLPDNSNEALAYVKDVSDKALSIITDSKVKEGDKTAKLSKLFEDSVDTQWIARFAMGTYWRDASDEQKNEYTKLHKQFLINSYVPKFKQYTNQKIVIKKAHLTDTDNEYMVETEIVNADGVSISVDYKVRKNNNGKYQIFDVVAEGVSLITTQRSEFGSILSRKGVDSLITQLKGRV